MYTLSDASEWISVFTILTFSDAKSVVKKTSREKNKIGFLKLNHFAIGKLGQRAINDVF